MLSNLPSDEADAAQILILYKGQEAVERRYSAFKGPLAVAALFCKNNRRIAALVTVICLALLIFCLIERQVRGGLAEEGKTKVEGLYAIRRDRLGSLLHEYAQVAMGVAELRAPTGQPTMNTHGFPVRVSDSATRQTRPSDHLTVSRHV